MPTNPAPDAEPARIGFLLQLAHNRLRGAIVAALDGSGLNPGQLSILGALAQRNDLTQRDLIAATRIEKSSMVIFLDRLEADGWIERRPHASDRRAHAVHLTDQGLDRLAIFGPRLIAAEAEVLSTLSVREKEVLATLLQRLSGIPSPD
jgi:DNA-binding MarR family transcriptional regulator